MNALAQRLADCLVIAQQQVGWDARFSRIAHELMLTVAAVAESEALTADHDYELARHAADLLVALRPWTFVVDEWQGSLWALDERSARSVAYRLLDDMPDTFAGWVPVEGEPRRFVAVATRGEP